MLRHASETTSVRQHEGIQKEKTLSPVIEIGSFFLTIVSIE